MTYIDLLNKSIDYLYFAYLQTLYLKNILNTLTFAFLIFMILKIIKMGEIYIFKEDNKKE